MATCADLVALVPTLPSGPYVLRPAGAGPNREAVPAFCDTTQRPAGQSLFGLPSGTMQLEGSTLCTMVMSNDDMDSTMMWVTLDGKVKTNNGLDTGGANWVTFSRADMRRGAQAGSAGYLWGDKANLYRPIGVSAYDKPIPFPGSGWSGGTVVWLGSSNVCMRR